MNVHSVFRVCLMPLSLLAQRVGPIHSLPLALHLTHQPGVKGQLPFNQVENLLSG